MWDDEATSTICDLGGIAIAFHIVQTIQYAIVGILPGPTGWVDPKTVPDSHGGDKLDDFHYFQPSSDMKTRMLLVVIGLFLGASILSMVLQMFADFIKAAYKESKDRMAQVANASMSVASASMSATGSAVNKAISSSENGGDNKYDPNADKEGKDGKATRPSGPERKNSFLPEMSPRMLEAMQAMKNDFNQEMEDLLSHHLINIIKVIVCMSFCW